MDEYKVLDSKWFTNATTSRGFGPDACIGVVAVETFAVTGEWKAYIGIGHGINLKADEQDVARLGSGLLPTVGAAFFPHLDIEKYKVDK